MRLPPLLVTGCALLIAYCASCSLLTDGALSDKPPETAGTGAGGTGQGGEGGAGGTGDCTLEPTPPGGGCPGNCHSCVNNTCIFDCNVDDQCELATLDCPDGFACDVRCSGNRSCAEATINCPAEYACNITCNEVGSCQDAIINCDSGVCSLECTDGAQACLDAVLSCGSKACTATCDPGQNHPDVQCGPSCDCTQC